jgi:cytochrome b
MREAAPASRDRSSGTPANSTSETVFVWDWPLRVWHWALAVLVLIACVTPNTFDSLHQLAGYSVIGLLAFRLVWGFFGTRHSRFDKVGLKLRAAPSYLKNIARGQTGRYLGLNPAGAAMLVALLALLVISAVSGAMQVTVRFFGVWWVEDTHAYSSNAIIALVGLHVAGTLLMSILQRENLVRAMFTGRKRQPGRGRPSRSDATLAAYNSTTT